MTPSLPPSTLAVACASGDTRAALEALRDELAGKFDTVPSYAIPALAGRLREVLLALADLADDDTEGRVDELVRQRQARRAQFDTTQTQAQR